MDEILCQWAPNSVYSCSQHGVAAARLTLELSESITRSIQKVSDYVFSRSK
jgi:hypothetical protein